MLAAERLFAEHGIEGVSLRQIGSAAGNANNSAVRYHFGSKDALIRAILGYRLPGLHQRRIQLIERRPPEDLRAWVSCQLTTIMEQSEQPGSHYLGFIAMLHRHGRRDVFEDLPADLRESTRAFHNRLDTLLDQLPDTLRARRAAQANIFILHAAADRERAHAHGTPLLPFDTEVAELTDAMTGFLQAPASPQSRTAPERAGLALWPPLL